MDELKRIQDEIVNLQKQADLMVAQRKAAAIEDVKAKIKAFGITSRDLGLVEKASSSRVGIPVPIKYQLNDQTWTGRGRQPKWVEDYLAAGGSLETVRIK